MTNWEQVLASPYLQLCWYMIIILILMVISRLNGGLVLSVLMTTAMLWIMVSTGYGVISSQPWMYVLHMLLAMLLALLFIIVVAWIIEKYGTHNYNDEGMIMILGIPNVYLISLGFSLAIKLGLEIIYWLIDVVGR